MYTQDTIEIPVSTIIHSGEIWWLIRNAIEAIVAATRLVF